MESHIPQMKQSTDYAEGPNHETVPENSPGLQPSQGASYSSSSSSSSSKLATRSNGVLEYWSTALCSDCTPRPRGWGCCKGDRCASRMIPGKRLKPFHGLELIALLALFLFAESVSGDQGQGTNKISPAPSSSPYTIVNHLGEADQQVRLLEDKLLTHRRTIDPFGIAIGGKFKGLPPVEQHAPATNLPVQAVRAATNELTLEKAIQQLPVGAVNMADHEALIGFQSIHEGDLLVLELSGHRFVLWVESIDRRGVQFCDINLQNHALKPFRFGPTQLPQASATGRSDVRDFLKEDGN